MMRPKKRDTYVGTQHNYNYKEKSRKEADKAEISDDFPLHVLEEFHEIGIAGILKSLVQKTKIPESLRKNFLKAIELRNKTMVFDKNLITATLAELVILNFG